MSIQVDSTLHNNLKRHKIRKIHIKIIKRNKTTVSINAITASVNAITVVEAAGLEFYLSYTDSRQVRPLTSWN